MNGVVNGNVPADEPLPPQRPQRQLDAVALEGIDDLVDAALADRALVKSRDFPELQALDLEPSDVKVVLFDSFSVESFAACAAARCFLKDNARYIGVNRGSELQDLDVDVSGKVVAMLGVCWSLEAMHDLVFECDSWPHAGPVAP